MKFVLIIRLLINRFTDSWIETWIETLYSGDEDYHGGSKVHSNAMNGFGSLLVKGKRAEPEPFLFLFVEVELLKRR